MQIIATTAVRGNVTFIDNIAPLQFFKAKIGGQVTVMVTVVFASVLHQFRSFFLLIVTTRNEDEL